MPRVYERRDLTAAQADMVVAAAKNDIPPAIDTQKSVQPNGLYTVICTYDDVAPTSDQPSKTTSGGGGAAPATPTKQKPAAATTPTGVTKTTKAGTAASAGLGQPSAGSQGQTMLTLGMLQRHWPHAAPEILQGMVETAPDVFAKLEINTPLRMAHFMGQISEECGAGSEMIENLNYRSAQRLMTVWPSRFPTTASAEPYVNNPRLLANKVYNGRMGNQVNTDDGYNFRGRGFLQLTGRSSYVEIGELCGRDLVNDPDLVVDPQFVLLISGTEFEHLGCLPWCDEDSVVEVSALINLGHLVSSSSPIVGLADRESWVKVWKNEFGV